MASKLPGAAMKHRAYVLLAFLLAAAAPICRPQQSDAATAAATTQDVEFRSGGVILSGTLLLPRHAIAGVVAVHGSGKELRYTWLANLLAAKGVATLVYDKRGVGESGGVYAGPEVGTHNTDPPNLDLLAEDASAAVKELVRRISSPRTPVGLIGTSQAGWIIPLAAVRTPDVKFIILWSGPLVTTVEQLRFQHLTGGKFDFWDHHSEAEVREHVRSDPDRYPFIATDPLDSLRKLSIPGLWLFGDRDIYVPVRLSIERLEALAPSGRPFEYHVIPNSGHNLPDDKAAEISVDWLMRTVIQHRVSPAS